MYCRFSSLKYAVAIRAWFAGTITALLCTAALIGGMGPDVAQAEDSWLFDAASESEARRRPGDTLAMVSRYRTGVSPRLTKHLRRTSGDRVFFGPGSARLGSKARTVLAAQALWMSERPKFGALISGYADDPGSSEENRRLAAKRANVVRARLIDEGVASHRVVVEVMGQAEPVALCRTSLCMAQNRRVLTRVLYDLPKVGQSNRPATEPSKSIRPHRGAALQIPRQ